MENPDSCEEAYLLLLVVDEALYFVHLEPWQRCCVLIVEKACPCRASQISLDLEVQMHCCRWLLADESRGRQLQATQVHDTAVRAIYTVLYLFALAPLQILSRTCCGLHRLWCCKRCGDVQCGLWDRHPGRQPNPTLAVRTVDRKILGGEGAVRSSFLASHGLEVRFCYFVSLHGNRTQL